MTFAWNKSAKEIMISRRHFDSKSFCTKFVFVMIVIVIKKVNIGGGGEQQLPIK